MEIILQRPLTGEAGPTVGTAVNLRHDVLSQAGFGFLFPVVEVKLGTTERRQPRRSSGQIAAAGGQADDSSCWGERGEVGKSGVDLLDKV